MAEHDAAQGDRRQPRTAEDSGVTAQPVPVLTTDEAQARIEAGDLGDIQRVQVAFSEADILLESALDPAVFDTGDSISAPTLLIHGTNGKAIGVSQCNAGYPGTGPSNSHRLLKALGFPPELARQVHDYRFIELDRDQVLRTSEDCLHTAGSGIQLSTDKSHFIVRISADTRSVTPWVNEILDQPERYPWVHGVRRARVLLDWRAPTAQAQRSNTGRAAMNTSLVVEQGRLQLWCAVGGFPFRGRELMGRTQLDVLAAVGVYPAGIRPRNWLNRLLPQNARRPAFIDISEDLEGLQYGTPVMDHIPNGRMKTVRPRTQR